MPNINNSINGNQQSLYALAEGTGGFVIVNTNDLLGGLEKIGREQNEYYVLGYAPSKESEPGACHTLRVKVDKGGSGVRSRSGYCEAKTADVLSGTPAERDLEARIGGNAPSTIPAASMRVPFFYISPNTARVDVALDLPAGALKFAREKGKFHSTMNVVGIAYLADGFAGARFSDSVKTAFDDQKEVDALKRSLTIRRSSSRLRRASTISRLCSVQARTSSANSRLHSRLSPGKQASLQLADWC